MLFAFPKFEFEAPSLQPEVGGDRRVAVRSMVGPGDAFLLRVGVIEGDDINVQRHVAILQRRDQALCALDEIDRAVVRHDPEPIRLGIEPLPKRFGGRDHRKPQRGLKVAVLPPVGDRLVVALPHAEKPKVSAGDVGMGDPPRTAGRRR